MCWSLGVQVHNLWNWRRAAATQHFWGRGREEERRGFLTCFCPLSPTATKREAVHDQVVWPAHTFCWKEEKKWSKREAADEKEGEKRRWRSCLSLGTVRRGRRSGFHEPLADCGRGWLAAWLCVSQTFLVGLHRRLASDRSHIVPSPPSAIGGSTCSIRVHYEVVVRIARRCNSHSSGEWPVFARNLIEMAGWNCNWPLFLTCEPCERVESAKKGQLSKPRGWIFSCVLLLLPSSVISLTQTSWLPPLNGKFIFLLPVLINTSPAAAWEAEKTHGPAFFFFFFFFFHKRSWNSTSVWRLVDNPFTMPQSNLLLLVYCIDGGYLQWVQRLQCRFKMLHTDSFLARYTNG